MARADRDLLAMALVGYEAEKFRIDGAINTMPVSASPDAM